MRNTKPPTMSKRAAIALGQSIVKWIHIIDKKDQAQGHDNCPLCTRYHRSADCWPPCSDKCPVVIYTGEQNCEGTPYGDFIDVARDGMVTGKTSKKAAKKMLNFLIDVSVSVPIK